MDTAILTVAPGQHSLSFDGVFSSGEKPHAKLEVRLMGAAENVEGHL